MHSIRVTVKPILSSHSKRRPKISFKTDYHLMQDYHLKCRSKVLQNAPREHSAILLTFIKQPFVFKIIVLSILSGRLKQVLLYLGIQISADRWKPKVPS